MELVGNDVSLVKSRDVEMMAQSLFAEKTQITALQRFIRSNGPKAYTCRTIWRRDHRPFSWIITNKRDFKNQDHV